jgi:hypothetical protein
MDDALTGKLHIFRRFLSHCLSLEAESATASAISIRPRLQLT